MIQWKVPGHMVVLFQDVSRSNVRFDFTSTLHFCPQGAYFSGDSARPELHIEATSLQSKRITARYVPTMETLAPDCQNCINSKFCWPLECQIWHQSDRPTVATAVNATDSVGIDKGQIQCPRARHDSHLLGVHSPAYPRSKPEHDHCTDQETNKKQGRVEESRGMTPKYTHFSKFHFFQALHISKCSSPA